MKKRLIGLLSLLCALFLLTGACAETISLSGTVIPAESVLIYAPIGGTVSAVNVSAGSQIREDAVLYTMKTTKIYADRDGTVTGIFAQPGDSADTVTERYGAVMYLEGASAYTVSASTDNAYSEVDTKFVHAGETVWLMCRSNNARTGKGIITAISGKSYTVEVTEGSFIVGDSVDIFRDEAHTTTLKVGRGSVSRTDPVAVTASGAVVRIAVEDGAQVRRGDLLLETLDGTFEGYEMTGTAVTAAEEGVVVSVSAEVGATVTKGDVVAQIAPISGMRVEAAISADDRQSLKAGDHVRIELEADESKTYEGTVRYITEMPEESTEETTEVTYKAVIDFTPDEDVYFGMAVVVTAGEGEAKAEEAE